MNIFINYIGKYAVSYFKLKNAMSSSGIELGSFRLVA
jgi:hypothetical protein